MEQTNCWRFVTLFPLTALLTRKGSGALIIFLTSHGSETKDGSWLSYWPEIVSRWRQVGPIFFSQRASVVHPARSVQSTETRAPPVVRYVLLLKDVSYGSLVRRVFSLVTMIPRGNVDTVPEINGRVADGDNVTSCQMFCVVRKTPLSIRLSLTNHTVLVHSLEYVSEDSQ